MNFWETIFLFFAFLSFLLSLLFFFKKRGDKTANKILSVYLVLFAFNLVYNVLYWSELLYRPESIHLLGTLALVWVMYPPLMYVYVRRFTKRSSLGLKDLVHLIPAIAMTVSYSRFFILSAQEKLNVLITSQFSDYLYFGSYIHGFTIVVMLFYSVLIYSSLQKSEQLDTNKKRWLRLVIGGFLCYVVSMITYFVLAYLALISTEHDYFIMYTIIFFIGLVSYFGFMQPEVFDGLPVEHILPFKKYKKTGLSPDLSEQLKSQLIELMEREKPYLNSDLRLTDLAEKLNVSTHHMSQIINEHFDSGFFHFINTYRIEEAKMLLSNDKTLTITEAIYQSGFNNRVSFYKSFKEHVGVTPSAFRLQYHSN